MCNPQRNHKSKRIVGGRTMCTLSCSCRKERKNGLNSSSIERDVGSLDVEIQLTCIVRVNEYRAGKNVIFRW